MVGMAWRSNAARCHYHRRLLLAAGERDSRHAPRNAWLHTRYTRARKKKINQRAALRARRSASRDA